MPGTHILHIIDSLTIGGAEKILVGTVNALPEYHHHVVYLGGSYQLGQDLPADCKIIRLGRKSKLDIIRCAWSLRQYIKRNNIAVVHSHLIMSTLIARLSCPSNVKLYSTIHSLLGQRFFGPGKRLQRIVERMTYKRRHHIIAVSEEVYHDYDRAIGIKGAYSILPNFVDNHYFRDDYKKSDIRDGLRIVAVGSLKPPKNYAYLIEAFKQLPGNIHLDIYGEGPLENELGDAIRVHKLNILLCGNRNNIYDILPGYDLFVMSSVFEGHPLALLEAMACGMPAAVSDIPVLREATDNKGIYFDLGDTGDFIARIKSIVDRQIDLDKYAKINLEIAKRISRKDKYIEMLKQIYDFDGRPAGPFLFQPVAGSGG